MSILKLEIKRAIVNRWMLFSLLAGLIICIIPIPAKYTAMTEYYENNVIIGLDKVICTDTVFQQFILYDRFEPVLYIFLFIMPLLATLPYGASYYNDLKDGYIKQVLSRCNIKTFLLSKYIAAFVSGGIVVTLPVVINFMILSLIFPANKPMRFYSLLNGEATFTIDLFFEHPILHTLFWCTVLFCVAGLLSTLALAVSRYIYNYFGIILTPFVFSFLLIFLTYVTGKTELSFWYSISTSCLYDFDYWILFAELGVMFVFSFFTFIFQKKEVL